MTPDSSLGDPSLADAFAEATSTLPGIERRKMFGYPAIFTGGNMVAGLHQDGIVLRLNATDRQALLAEEKAKPFVAMGRVMREWVVAMPAMPASGDELRVWLGRALAHTAALPPKPKRQKRA